MKKEMKLPTFKWRLNGPPNKIPGFPYNIFHFAVQSCSRPQIVELREKCHGNSLKRDVEWIIYVLDRRLSRSRSEQPACEIVKSSSCTPSSLCIALERPKVATRPVENT